VSANYQKIQQEKKRGRAEETRLTSESSHPEKIRSSEPTGEVSGFEVRSDLNLKICGDGSVEGSTVDAERDESKGGQEREGEEREGGVRSARAFLPLGALACRRSTDSPWFLHHSCLRRGTPNVRDFRLLLLIFARRRARG